MLRWGQRVRQSGGVVAVPVQVGVEDGPTSVKVAVAVAVAVFVRVAVGVRVGVGMR